MRNPAVLRDVGDHWTGLDDLEIATFTWVSWFNEERIHADLGDTTPAEIEANSRDHSQLAATCENLANESPGNSGRFLY